MKSCSPCRRPLAYCLLALVLLAAPAVRAAKFVGDYSEWSVYGHDYVPADIPADKLTHINYAFIVPAGPDANGNYACAISDTWAAEQKPLDRLVPGTDTSKGEDLGTLNQLRKLRSWRLQNGQVLPLILIVGGSSGSGAFSGAAATDATRTAFANSCVGLMMNEAFDGLEIDWEFPASTETANVTALLQKLRGTLDAQGTDPRTGAHYLLTLAGPGDAYYLSRFDVAGIQPYLDWVDVMSYDFHGCWGGTDHTGHNAPLYGSADDPDGATFSVSQGISDWISRGMPAAKILLGLPYYGKAFQALTDAGPNGSYPGRYAGVDPAQNDGTTCAPGTWGNDGGLDYWDLAANYVNVNGYVHYWDGQQGVPFLWKDLTRWVTYDDAQSLAGKATFARNQGLGGVFVWELSLESAPTQVPKTYPLTNAVAGSLNP
ncbi:MAG TPA: glycoside hydrolase family 18 protein [Thermoanaerobaculia bacterium]